MSATAKTNKPTSNFPALRWRRRRSWILATLVAVLANCALFLLMPALIAPTEATPAMRQLIGHVNVIRIKHPEPPVKKRQTPPPEPEQSKPQPEKSPTQQVMQTNAPHLSLPFKLNQRLPALATDLKMPPAAVGALNLDGIVGAAEMDQLDAPLTTLSRIPPVYPMRAQRRGIEGWVKVRFLVDEEGQVSQIEVLESSPSDIFNRSVRQCVSRWRFKPGTIEGVTVKTWMQSTVRFEMSR